MQGRVGGVNLDYLPWRGESEKLKKGVEVRCRGRSPQKRGCGNHFTLWRINFFSATIILGKKGHSKLSKNESENIPQMKIIYL